jgi:hypothetical protein
MDRKQRDIELAREVGFNTEHPATNEWLHQYAQRVRAQREWVGLTDEEVADLGRHELWIKQFIRIVEAKLRSKNGY